MIILVRFSAGRVLLHVVAMLLDHSWRFHWEGIVRELPYVPLTRLGARFSPAGGSDGRRNQPPLSWTATP
jgi:hypothetical protein